LMGHRITRAATWTMESAPTRAMRPVAAGALRMEGPCEAAG
jgi:hypothetical protein